MKRLLIASLLLLATSSLAQQTINGSIQHDGIQRDYILYVPASYTPGTDAPLVINFHGYTSNAMEQMFYGDFRPIADTAGFLLIHPQGTLDGSGQTYWNANWGGTVDDIGFTDALIDSIAADYSVNLNRVYSTGMSNGGFMSYTLACSLSERIAAIASVTGSMNSSQTLTCLPQHSMPVMQIHGTADGVVPYNGNVTMLAIPDVITYWSNNNGCDPTPVETAVQDSDPFDGCTATHFLYSNPNDGIDVELYRVNGGGHTWPGASVTIGVTNQDFNASKEIWRFFSKFDINGTIASVEEINTLKLALYPNPTNDLIQVIGAEELMDTKATLMGASGNIIQEFTELGPISTKDLSKGVYYVRIQSEKGESLLKFVRN